MSSSSTHDRKRKRAVRVFENEQDRITAYLKEVCCTMEWPVSGPEEEDMCSKKLRDSCRYHAIDARGREKHEIITELMKATPECAICQEYFKLGESTTTLGCFHEFHLSCIVKSAVSQIYRPDASEPTCPLCRTRIR